MKKDNDINRVLPDVFNSVEDAVKTLKLDRRHKWEEWNGELYRPYKYSHTCTGCDGGGCRECGYHGKSITYAPVPALMPNGSVVKVSSLNLRVKQ